MQVAMEWFQEHCEGMPLQICHRLGRMMVGVPQAPGQVFDQVLATAVGWRLNFAPNYCRKGEELLDDKQAWRIMGMHGTDPQGIRGMVREGHMRGSEDLPHVYFASFLGAGPGHIASGIDVFNRVAAGKKNKCGIMVELTAKRRYQTYHDFSDRWKKGELTPQELAHGDDLCGTTWNKFVRMERGDIAHYYEKGHNRWSASPFHLTVVALWVSRTALEDDIM